MPFSTPFARSFTLKSIANNAPAAAGVFGISNSHHWIVIGETPNIRFTLLQYLSSSDQNFRRYEPTGFSFELCDAAAQTARREQLVLEYRPAANRQN